MAGLLKNVLGGDGSGFFDLAKELAQRWSKDVPGIWNQYKVADDQIVRGLVFLLRIGRLAKSTLDPKALLSDRINAAETAIREFQERMGKDKDGVLGRQTLRVMEDFRNCPTRDDSDKEDLDKNALPKVVNDALEKAKKHHMLFYFVDSSVPTLIDGKRNLDLIADAWDMWIANEKKILIRRVDERENANVIIECKGIDGSFGTLGVAHVGGPKINARLICTLDEDENWTEKRFRGAACHEFGHILGLNHTDEAKQLMNPFLSTQLDIIEPQQGDINELKRIWA